MSDLIFEIGCEEIPASYIDPALVWFAENAVKELQAARLSFGEVLTKGTPRRLVLIVRDVADKQSDLNQEILGPRAEAAWDASGKLTPQARGFLSAKKIDEAQAYKKSTPKGDVLAAQILETGKDAVTVLPELLVRLMTNMPFPKTMRWEQTGATFARPIRWLLALCGTKQISFEFAGVASGNVTCGHRFLSPEWVQVKGVEDYLTSLNKKFVMLDAGDRREAIWNGALALAKEAGGILVRDDALLDIVKNLMEYPWPLLGKFESRYLEIPREILISEMREHQKYFAVQDKDGKLLPCFVVVAGSQPKDSDDVAAGHARVLRARFEDGSFYYYEDLKHAFKENVAKLERVQFQRELGSVLDKVKRIEDLVQRIAAFLQWNEQQISVVSQAAHLCKADLVSGVVAQFPELQGIMGGYYASRSGSSSEVASAVRDHYMPRFAGDSLPKTDAGCLLSLSDKLDTIVGVIGVGKAPKGNADPFALRRAAIAITRIIAERGLRVSIKRVIEGSAESYGSRLKATAEMMNEITSFIVARARGVFLEDLASKGAPNATILVDAAIAAGSDDLADLSARIEALYQLQSQNAEQFAQLAATFKRAGNIVQKAIVDHMFEAGAILDASKLEAPSEKQLLVELEKSSRALGSIAKAANINDLQSGYVAAMQEIAGLKTHVDRFFDEVMVMVEDKPLRTARLALLHRLQSAVNVVADFTRIQA